MDAATYAYIWERCYWLSSDAQVFNGRFEIKYFVTPTQVERFFYGSDWGFSRDPTAVVRSYVQDGCLYIDSEAVGVNVEIDDLPQLFRRVKCADKWLIKPVKRIRRQAIRFTGLALALKKPYAGLMAMRLFLPSSSTIQVMKVILTWLILPVMPPAI